MSVAFPVVKLKIFKAFVIDSASMKLSPFRFWALLPKILFNLAEILTRGNLAIRQTEYLKNPSKV